MNARLGHIELMTTWRVEPHGTKLILQALNASPVDGFHNGVVFIAVTKGHDNKLLCGQSRDAQIFIRARVILGLLLLADKKLI